MLFKNFCFKIKTIKRVLPFRILGSVWVRGPLGRLVRIENTIGFGELDSESVINITGGIAYLWVEVE